MTGGLVGRPLVRHRPLERLSRIYIYTYAARVVCTCCLPPHPAGTRVIKGPSRERRVASLEIHVHFRESGVAVRSKTWESKRQRNAICVVIGNVAFVLRRGESALYVFYFFLFFFTGLRFFGGRTASAGALTDERVATSLSSIRSLIKTPERRLVARLKKAAGLFVPARSASRAACGRRQKGRSITRRVLYYRNRKRER